MQKDTVPILILIDGILCCWILFLHFQQTSQNKCVWSFASKHYPVFCYKTILLWPEPLCSHQNWLLEPPPTVPAKFYQRQGCRSQGEQRYAVCFHSSVLNIINSDESCIRVWYPAPRSCTNCDSGEGKVSRSFRLNSEKGACVSFNRVSILQISTKRSTKLSFSSCELLLECRNKWVLMSFHFILVFMWSKVLGFGPFLMGGADYLQTRTRTDGP